MAAHDNTVLGRADLPNTPDLKVGPTVGTVERPS
jgi:hypothetical protein